MASLAQGLFAKDQDSSENDQLGWLLDDALPQACVGGKIVDRHFAGAAGGADDQRVSFHDEMITQQAQRSKKPLFDYAGKDWNF